MKIVPLFCVVYLVVFSFPLDSFAYECTVAGTDGAGGCYVDMVEVYTKDAPAIDDTSVVARILDPKGLVPGISYIKIRQKSGKATIDTIQGALSQMVLSLTLGLPVSFTCYSITNNICDLQYIKITRPGL